MDPWGFENLKDYTKACTFAAARLWGGQYVEPSHWLVWGIWQHFFLPVFEQEERKERVNSLNHFLGLLCFPMTSILPRSRHSLKNSATNNFPRAFNIILNSALSRLGKKNHHFPCVKPHDRFEIWNFMSRTLAGRLGRSKDLSFSCLQNTRLYL